MYASDSKHYYGSELIKVYIDEMDFLKCKQYGWYVSKKGYIYTIIDNHTIMLHRFLFDNIKDDLVVDHHDGNKLNNTRSNLIFMTNKENLEKAWYIQNLYNTEKPICMYEKDDYLYKNPIKEFSSQREAESYLKENGYKTSQGAIANACNGVAKTSGGYRWRFK